MLQPRNYPELIGKTLVLEAEPFVIMTEDDNPWVEGLFLTVSVGFVIGVAHLLGGLLMTASLPPAAAVQEAILQGWRQFSQNFGASVDPVATANTLRWFWALVTTVSGYGGGWFRLFTLVTTPFLLVIQWLVTGLLIFITARSLGGRGTLNQTLGATALMVAPHALALLTIIPFVSVSNVLLLTWSLLIVYRAAEVTHGLAWQRAIWVALAPIGLLIIIALLFGLLVSTGIFTGVAS